VDIKHFDEMECPQCGSGDVDLAEEVVGPVFQCQECLHRFDPPQTDASKPLCQLVGTDGNVFAVIARVSRCLKRSGQPDRAQEWVRDATNSHSYDEVIQKTFNYVDPM